MLPSLLFGCLLPAVVRMNEALGRTVGQLPGSVLVHAVGGVFGALCVLPFVDRTWLDSVPRTPWWGWLGGVVGVLLVVLANRGIGTLGTAGFTALTVAVQLVASALIDRFGLFGAEPSPFTLTRVAGMCLLGVGATLVVRG
jgi:transporter family-2 protein